MYLPSSFAQREYKWTTWKSIAAIKKFQHQYEDDGTRYTVWGYDGPEAHICIIYKGSVPHATIEAGYSQEQNDADKADFEANYKTAANRPIVPYDPDGSQIIRYKTTRSGWHFEPRALDFITATTGSLYNRKHDGNGIDDGTDYGDGVLKFYDASGTQLVQGGSETTQDYQTRLDENCVKTFLDWHPIYDLEIIDCDAVCLNAPASPTRAYYWVIAAPDIPTGLGGSVPFVAGGWNLQFMQNLPVYRIDGRGPKYFAYDPVYKSNKFRVVIKHSVGAKIPLQFIAGHFRA